MMVSFSPTERRLFDRFPARFPVKFKDSRKDFGDNVQLRDASAQGAHIVSKERFYLNDSISLEVEVPDGKAPLVLRGAVVWARNASPNSWDIGLKFYKVNLVPMSRLYKYVAPEVPAYS